MQAQPDHASTSPPTISHQSDAPSSASSLDREFQEAINASNAFLAFIGPLVRHHTCRSVLSTERLKPIFTQAVFMASISVALLSFSHDKFADRAGDDDDPPPERLSDQAIYACFYLAAVLALIPSALSWFTHGGMLTALANNVAVSQRAVRITHSGESRRELMKQAIKEMSSYDDSLFWVINFLTPSVLSMLTGITLLVWTEHGLNVAIVITVGLAYCVVQVLRVIDKLAAAMFSDKATQRSPTIFSRDQQSLMQGATSRTRTVV